MLVRLYGVNDFSLIEVPNKIAYAIFLQGCKHNCKGCHNIDSWDMNGGEVVEIYNLFVPLKDNLKHYEAVAILGGEPLEQLGATWEIVRKSKELGLEVWLYTGYEIEDVPIKILAYCDYIVCGRWVEDLATGGFPASSNQRVINTKQYIQNLFRKRGK